MCIEFVDMNPHALANFMVECTIDNQEVGGQEVVPRKGKGLEKEDPEVVPKEYWINFNGESKTKLSGNIPRWVHDLPTTNNEAERKAVIAILGLVGAPRVKTSKSLETQDQK